jgi:two-component system OmpR family sensor kinase
MNKQSIFFTILVSFLISIVLVIISFLVLITHDYRMKEGQLLDKYHPVIRLLNKQDFISSEHLLRNLEEMNYRLILDRNEVQNILNNSKTKLLVEKGHPVRNDELFRILNLEETNYLFLQKRGNFLLIKDENSPTESNSQIYNSCHFLSFRDGIIEKISDFFIMRITNGSTSNGSTLNGKGGMSCIVLLY